MSAQLKRSDRADWREAAREPQYWREPYRERRVLSPLRVLGLAALGLAVVGAIALAPDIKRYIRISTM
jgi:hypothetical protein